MKIKRVIPFFIGNYIQSKNGDSGGMDTCFMEWKEKNT